MALKVLQLCAVDFTLAKFLAPFCFFLKERGYDVTAACSESEFMAPLRERGLRCVDLPIARSANLASHARSYLRLGAWLREEKFDIVHVHTPIAALIGRVAAARRGVPIRIYTAHGFYFHDRMPAHKRAFHVGLERFGALFTHYLFTQSDEDRETALRLGIAREGRVRTIGNGVDPARFDPARFTEADRAEMRRSLGIDPAAPVLGIIGRLVREKGYYELFEAMRDLRARIPGLRLLVVGDALTSDHDDHSENFQRTIDALGIRDAIVFAGQRPDVPELLHAMDVFTLPSYREGMPRSVIEAMTMGLPCVVTDIRGCREEVLDGESGYVVPVGDAAPLADRCGRLLSDPARAREMGAAARRRALVEFTEEAVFQRQIEVYEQLIRKRIRF
ncbi:glycosyltransferase family 4 protein [Candidatus Sumerlaeota bacterium]|nr:glycosyltransferase family 4 protein [Candidatus Sumerlaeota bacterium]